jgi:hypothetical protein
VSNPPRVLRELGDELDRAARRSPGIPKRQIRGRLPRIIAPGSIMAALAVTCSVAVVAAVGAIIIVGHRHATPGGAGSSAAPVTKPSARSVASICKEASQEVRVPVLCPTSLPGAPLNRFAAGRAWVKHDLPCSYLVTADSPVSSSQDDRFPGHVWFGGTCLNTSLAVVRGHWPAHPIDSGFDAPYLQLVGETPRTPRSDKQHPVSPRAIERTRVGAHPALILQIAPLPLGGPQGGHYAVVWNQNDATYVLSFLYQRGDRGLPPIPNQIATLLQAAEAMNPVP